MRRIILIISLFTFFVSQALSQCSPNFIYTSLGLPGVYPPSVPVQIPGSPLPMGISDGQIGVNYNETLTVVVLEDTSMDIAFLLPTAAVTAMNAAGLSTTMTLDVNHVTFDVQGLPNGLLYQCDQSNCEYPSSVDGCIQLSGIPAQAGNFMVPVSMLINVQIPAITDPLFGTTIFPATAMDIPSFTANEYDLYISDGATGVKDIEEKFSMFPNPTKNNFTIEVESPKKIRIFNSLGMLVFHQDARKSIKIDKLEIGTGIFIVEISDNYHVRQQKLIIQ